MFNYEKTYAVVGYGVKAHLSPAGTTRNKCGAGSAGRSTWKPATTYATFITEAVTVEEIAEALIIAGHDLCGKCFSKVGA
jgi:hypothetical protein